MAYWFKAQTLHAQGDKGTNQQLIAAIDDRSSKRWYLHLLRLDKHAFVVGAMCGCGRSGVGGDLLELLIQL